MYSLDKIPMHQDGNGTDLHESFFCDIVLASQIGKISKHLLRQGP